MRREERVTVQGPVKEQQLDGMSHRGSGWVESGVAGSKVGWVGLVQNTPPLLYTKPGRAWEGEAEAAAAHVALQGPPQTPVHSLTARGVRHSCSRGHMGHPRAIPARHTTVQLRLASRRMPGSTPAAKRK